MGRASTDELASTAEVVDLLLALTTAAATHPTRAKLILTPFPMIVEATGQRKKILNPKKPNYALAAEIARQLPSMQQLVSSESSSSLVDACASSGPHAYALFNWILSSNQAHIVSLQGPHRIQSMGTKYQFLMRSASPEGEKYFDTLKKKHGSCFGFHGSDVENWHSILRNGIRNMSGTALQINGAAYGKGVYISPSAAMSLGYSRLTGSTRTTSYTKSVPPLLRTSNIFTIVFYLLVYLLLRVQICIYIFFLLHSNVYVADSSFIETNFFFSSFILEYRHSKQRRKFIFIG